MTLVDALNDARDALDTYSRTRDEASWARVELAFEALKQTHDADVLPRSLERRRRVALARIRRERT